MTSNLETSTIVPIDQMLANREEAQALAAMERVGTTLERFAECNAALRGARRPAHERLLAAVVNLHARTVWAATRRAGRFWNFDVIQYIGDGAAAEAKVRSSEVVAGLTAVIHDHRDVPELVSAHGLLGQTLVNAAPSTPRVTTPSPCILNRWDELRSSGTDVRSPTEQAGGITARGSGRLREWFEENVELREELERRVGRVWETRFIAPLRKSAGLTVEHSITPPAAAAA